MDQNDKNPEGQANGAGNEGIDLSGALEKSSGNSENSGYSSGRVHPWNPKMIQWVIKYSGGLVQTKQQAHYVLIGFVALAVIIVLFLIFGGGIAENRPPLPPEQELSPKF